RQALKYFKDELLENDQFYEDIPKLRHYYIHVRGSKQKESREKHEEEFKRCCEKRGLARLSNDFEYFQLQLKILEDFLCYLNKIDNIIRTKI
ncbi:MAG: hypothetical protein ACE5HI_16930, partial [bacterium]